MPATNGGGGGAASTASASAAAKNKTSTSFLSPTQEDLLPGEQDMPFEEELLRDPYSVKTWCRYLASRGAASLGGDPAAAALRDASSSDSSSSVSRSTPGRRRVLFERALRALPGSYKLWHAYLTELISASDEAATTTATKTTASAATTGNDDGDDDEARNVDTSGRPFSPRSRDLASVFERALVTMHKMPVIWKMYLEHLSQKCSGITRLRRAFDSALRALPLAQHERWVWPLYLEHLATKPETPLTTARAVYRRYLLLKPGHVEEYVAFLEARSRWGEAARRLAAAIDDDGFVSVEGASRHQLWLRLAELVTRHPREVAAERGLDADSILRAGIRAAAAVAKANSSSGGGGGASGGGGSGGQGRLWCALADHHIRLGAFEAARSVLEEGMRSVAAVSDFALVFDSLAQLEESLIARGLSLASSAAAAAEEEEGEGKGKGEEAPMEGVEGGSEEDEAKRRAAARDFLVRDAKRSSSSSSSSLLNAAKTSNDGDDLDLRLARLEHLTQRRPLLLSAVALRQNPHAVNQWHRRASLLAEDPAAQIRTYTQAVAAVDPRRATGGRVWTLWSAFARVYEEHGDFATASRVVFARALGVDLGFSSSSSSSSSSKTLPTLSYSFTEPAKGKFAYADDVARLWCAWAEAELRNKKFAFARAVLRLATARPPPSLFFPGRTAPLTPEEERDSSLVPPTARAYRSLRIWSMRCDVEESLGTCDDAAACYEAALDLRVASAQMVLNFASMLVENRRFEAAFRCYERGTQLFKYPAAKDIWASYLRAFIERYEAGLSSNASSKISSSSTTSTSTTSSSSSFDPARERERARDLLRCAIAAAPPSEKADLFLQASSFEEKHGPPREAIALLERGVLECPAGGGKGGTTTNGRRKLYDALLAKSSLLFGVSKVREVFERVLELEADKPGGLPDADALELARQWASLEARLGEVERARAVFAHASSMADPRTHPEFWDAWSAFEVSSGNEDTFREMLRCKRAVRASFPAGGAHLPLASAGAAAAEAAARGGAAVAAAVAAASAAAAAAASSSQKVDAMSALEAAAAAPATLAPGTAVPGFVSGGTVAATRQQPGLSSSSSAAAAKPAAAAPVAKNPDEIDIDDEDDDVDGDDDDDVVLETKAVPAAVFGSAAAAAKEKK